MIDFHSHILPGADHGSQSVEMSLELIDAAIAAGIDTIVATPHFYLSEGKTVNTFLNIRSEAYAKLQPHLSARNVSFRFGAEVRLRFGLSELDGLEKLCIDNTNTLLLEMPSDKVWSDWVYNEIFKIRETRGIQPIIAHIDRYDAAQVEKLFDYIPLMAQINVESLCGFFSKRRILRYFDEGYVFALGSDVHRSAVAYEQFTKAMKVLGEGGDCVMQRAEELLNRENSLIY